MKKIFQFIEKLSIDNSYHLSQISDIRYEVQKEISSNKSETDYCNQLYRILEVYDGNFAINITNDFTHKKDEELLRKVNELTVKVLKIWVQNN